MHRLHQTEITRTLVRAQIQPCHEGGMLAQGVNDAWAGRWLAGADCDVIQGVWVGSVMGREEVQFRARWRAGNPGRHAESSARC